MSREWKKSTHSKNSLKIEFNDFYSKQRWMLLNVYRISHFEIVALFYYPAKQTFAFITFTNEIIFLGFVFILCKFIGSWKTCSSLKSSLLLSPCRIVSIFVWILSIRSEWFAFLVSFLAQTLLFQHAVKIIIYDCCVLRARIQVAAYKGHYLNVYEKSFSCDHQK